MVDEEERAYKVNNKRKLSDKAAQETAEPTPLADDGGVYIPSNDDPDEPAGIDFGSFVISLGHNAYVSMGKVGHPETGEMIMDVDNARQMIEILEMLDKKTEGNLDTEEDRLLKGLLYELRIAFLEISAEKV